MSFKRTFLKPTVVVSGVFVIMSMVSCSRFLNEKKEMAQTLPQENERFSCLKQLPTRVNLFLGGELQPAQLREGIDCSNDVLTYFNKKANGSVQEGHTPEDLRGFFNTYFLKKNEVTPEFAAELFKLKKLILGGSSSVLTKTEIQKLIDLLQTLKEPLVQLTPHMPILLMSAPSASAKAINVASSEMTSTLMLFLGRTEWSRSDYTFLDFKNLMQHLNAFLGNEKSAGLYQRVQQNAGLMEAVKNIFIGETPHFDGLADWQRALQTLTDLHLEFLRYHYLLDSPASTGKYRMTVLTQMIDAGFELVSRSMPMSQRGRIPFKDVDGLLAELSKRGLLPTRLNQRTLANIYKVVVLKMFDAKRNGDGRDLEAVEKSHFLAIQHEWRIFKLHQLFLDSLPFDSTSRIPYANVIDAIKKQGTVDSFVAGLTTESLEQDRLNIAWQEGKGLLLSDFPAMYDADGKALVQLDPQLQQTTWSSLTKWNVVRALSRVLILGYGTKESTEVYKNKIMVEGLQAWYKDFRDLGIELKAFDPRSGNSGSRSFKEANFFTFHGDGNGEMSATETFELVSLLVSGGFSSANEIRGTEMVQRCGLPERDVFDFPWFKENCFKQSLRDGIATYFSNLPGLVKEVRSMSDKQWDEFYTDLMAASRTSDSKGERVETSDIRTSVMILHYVEALMVVYDENHNGTLDRNEVQKAAPRFRNFIVQSMKKRSTLAAGFTKMLPTLGDALADDVFLYLVFNGELPNVLSREYLTVYQGAKMHDNLGEVSRGKILAVFKVLKDEAAKK